MMNGVSPPRACLWCGTFLTAPLFMGVKDRLGFVPGQWDFLQCTACGSANLSPMPSLQQIASYYPRNYGFSMESDSRLGRFARKAEEFFFYRFSYGSQARKVLRAVGGDGRGKRLLDIGCGNGWLLRRLQQYGFDLHGVDFQPDTVEYVKTRLRIPTICTDASNVSGAYPANSFDVITTFHLLEHLPDVGQMLRTCIHLLRPGGFLIAAMPLIDSMQARIFGRHWHAVTEAPRHLSIPTQRAAIRACAEAGFQDVSIRPDALLACTGVAALSLLPRTSSGHLPSMSPLASASLRGLAGVLTYALLPWCAMEGYVLGRPAAGIVCARKG